MSNTINTVDNKTINDNANNPIDNNNDNESDEPDNEVNDDDEDSELKYNARYRTELDKFTTSMKGLQLDLINKNIFFAPNHTCCNTCAHYEIKDAFNKFVRKNPKLNIDPAKLIGYTYYHNQDFDRVKEDIKDEQPIQVYIGYGLLNYSKLNEIEKEQQLQSLGKIFGECVELIDQDWRFDWNKSSKSRFKIKHKDAKPIVSYTQEELDQLVKKNKQANNKSYLNSWRTIVIILFIAILSFYLFRGK